MKKDFVIGLIAGIIFAFVFSFLVTNGNIGKSLLITLVSCELEGLMRKKSVITDYSMANSYIRKWYGYSRFYQHCKHSTPFLCYYI